MAAPVRVDEQTRASLRSISKQTGKSMQQIVADAVEKYRRWLILERGNAAWARLKADPKRWAEVESERRLWDRALRDGLEEE